MKWCAEERNRIIPVIGDEGGRDIISDWGEGNELGRGADKLGVNVRGLSMPGVGIE